MNDPAAAIDAQADLHHAWFLGLQLMVSTRRGPEVMGDWMFRLFSRQHEEKFLSGMEKLGLRHLPDAVACAQYHVLSNSVGGVRVEYLPESDTKAWVRFRYPRWMYAGPVICGIPVEVSRGFLRGWYARNGASLGNPRLGFVCVSEDMTAQFGLCGYFYEAANSLSDDERLRFAPEERPPDFSTSPQPELPSAHWGTDRLRKARRNYALEYVRNGLRELARTIGSEAARDLGQQSARLIGLQYQAEMAARVGAADTDLEQAALYLTRMLEGMGDTVERLPASGAAKRQIRLSHTGLRIVRGLPDNEAALLLACWGELWRGSLAAQRLMKELSWRRVGENFEWTLTLAPTGPS